MNITFSTVRIALHCITDVVTTSTVVQGKFRALILAIETEYAHIVTRFVHGDLYIIEGSVLTVRYVPRRRFVRPL